MNRAARIVGLSVWVLVMIGCGDDEPASTSRCGADAVACDADGSTPLPPLPPAPPPSPTPPPPPPADPDAGARPECVGALMQEPDEPSAQTVRFRLSGPATGYVVTAGDGCSPAGIDRGPGAPVALGATSSPLCEGPPAWRPAATAARRLDTAAELTWDARELATTAYGCFDCGPSHPMRYQSYPIRAMQPVAPGRYRATFAILDAVDGTVSGCTDYEGTLSCPPASGSPLPGAEHTVCPGSRFVTVDFELPPSGDLVIDVEVPPLGEAAEGDACGGESGASCGAWLSCCGSACASTCPPWRVGCEAGCSS